ncbi:MAG: hypothetical protein WCP69_14260 [Bacteroidota bacterium]
MCTISKINLITLTKQFATDYQNVLDWNGTVALQSEEFVNPRLCIENFEFRYILNIKHKQPKMHNRGLTPTKSDSEAANCFLLIKLG